MVSILHVVNDCGINTKKEEGRWLMMRIIVHGKDIMEPTELTLMIFRVIFKLMYEQDRASTLALCNGYDQDEAERDCPRWWHGY